jgi:subfamily B ATP-binding cassette protein MsbA
MLTFFKTLRFGSKYLRRYWLRFFLGILLGSCFGLTNGLTMGSIYLVLNRLDPDSGQVSKPAHEPKPSLVRLPASLTKPAREIGNRIEHDFNAALDPWLPSAGRTPDWKQALGVLLIFPLVAALRGSVSYATTYCLAWTGQRIANDVKEDVFRKLSSFSLDFFHRHTTAQLMNRVNDDTGALYVCLRLGLSDLIKEPATLVILFCTLVWIDAKLTLMALCFAPLCIVPTRIVSRRLKQLAEGDNSAGVDQNALVMEAFQNTRITKAYDLAPEQVRLFRLAGNAVSRLSIKAVQARAFLHPVIEILSGFGIGLVVVYAAWAGVPVKLLVTYLFALVMFYQPCKKLSTIGAYFTQAGYAMDRLLAVFELQPTVREIERPRTLPAFSHALEFRQVAFSYGDETVLHDIDLAVPRGQRIGLAGESGSGKSTLLNLLFRFYDPTAGQILFDGVPIDQVRLADLRSQIALVSQDVQLFNTTVAENIGYGKLGSSRDEIVAAARSAFAHDFIMDLPAGYETPLGEGGLRLSGGQRQRIAIARAFVRNAPILVLDEATASLDSKAEAEVQRAIDHLEENRTVLCVAHRLSTLRDMSRIVVMKAGRIVETGTFTQLLGQQGIFARMAAHQQFTVPHAVSDTLCPAT